MKAAEPIRRPILLLGASNLTLGWKPMLTALVREVAEPLDVFVAMGLGRSYIDWSRFLYRRLPGILDCNIWDAMQRSAAPCRARVLITDLGNDLVYGRQPEQVVAAAAECIQRIRAWSPNALIAVTRPPVESVQSLSNVRFRIARRILFPQFSLDLPTIRDRTERMDALLTDLGATLNITIHTPRAEWYGVDPIHVRRSWRSEVFAGFFAGWRSTDNREGADISARTSTSSSFSTRRPIAYQTEIRGTRRETLQPSVDSPAARIFCY